MRKILLIFLCLAATVAVAVGQTRRRSKPPAKKPAATSTPAPQPSPSPDTAEARPEPKKNQRPEVSNGAAAAKTQTPPVKPAYVYEFSRPEFIVSKVHIEHDETGRGTITFLKMGLDIPESDPIALSPTTLDRINAALTALDFLNSKADYQYERDYSHLGNVSFTFRKDGRERTVKYNYSGNEFARALADEYRKIGNQYVWQFDMAIARENQPLTGPSLMGVLDSYIRRKEISDPVQMLPLLRELSNDERIPLIARNHADRIVKQIEKEVEKEKKKGRAN